MQTLDDRFLLRLKAGEAAAFGEFYSLFRSRVYRFALKLLRDSDQAEDITQEVFLKAQKAIQNIHTGGSILSWLLTITRNEVYNQLRKTRSNGQVGIENVWEEETPLDDLVGRETVEIVQMMITNLKPAYREVILLREYERLSYTEIAQVIGETEGAVKARLFKARKALVVKLKPYLGE